VGFVPAISAGERPQTYALDRATTGTKIEVLIGKIVLVPFQILPHLTNPTFSGPGLNQNLRGERPENNSLNRGRNNDLSTLQIQDPFLTSHKTNCFSIT
jgi:hypothetical protein